MKSIKELITDIENSGVFTYKNCGYYCTGYHIDVTEAYAELHKQLLSLRQWDKPNLIK